MSHSSSLSSLSSESDRWLGGGELLEGSVGDSNSDWLGELGEDADSEVLRRYSDEADCRLVGLSEDGGS